jgi:hypothetical protein
MLASRDVQQVDRSVVQGLCTLQQIQRLRVLPLPVELDPLSGELPRSGLVRSGLRLGRTG